MVAVVKIIEDNWNRCKINDFLTLLKVYRECRVVAKAYDTLA